MKRIKVNWAGRLMSLFQQPEYGISNISWEDRGQTMQSWEGPFRVPGAGCVKIEVIKFSAQINAEFYGPDAYRLAYRFAKSIPKSFI